LVQGTPTGDAIAKAMANAGVETARIQPASSKATLTLPADAEEKEEAVEEEATATGAVADETTADESGEEAETAN